MKMFMLLLAASLAAQSVPANASVNVDIDPSSYTIYQGEQIAVGADFLIEIKNDSDEKQTYKYTGYVCPQYCDCGAYEVDSFIVKAHSAYKKKFRVYAQAKYNRPLTYDMRSYLRLTGHQFYQPEKHSQIVVYARA